MIKLSIRDTKFVNYQLNQLLENYDLAENLKSFLILNLMAHDSSTDYELKRLLMPVYNALGIKIKDEISAGLEKWLKTHTSGEGLLDWNEYEDDKEGTWAWSLVDSGEMETSGHTIDIKPMAVKNLLKLATEKYGRLPRDDRESFKAIQDELSFSYDSQTWKESLSEDFREFIARKYTPYVFKQWRETWGEKLDKPTKDVSEAVGRLRSSSTNELAGAISMALNVCHVHGKMYEHLDLSQRDLDYLDHIPEEDILQFKNDLIGDEELNFSTAKRKFSIREANQNTKFWFDPSGKVHAWPITGGGDKYSTKPHHMDKILEMKPEFAEDELGPGDDSLIAKQRRAYDKAEWDGWVAGGNIGGRLFIRARPEKALELLRGMPKDLRQANELTIENGGDESSLPTHGNDPVLVLMREIRDNPDRYYTASVTLSHRKANYIPNTKTKMPSPIKKNHDYGGIPNWIDRVKWHQKRHKKRKSSLETIINQSKGMTK